MGFPGSSNGKESACNAGALGSVPGSGGSPGERNDWLPTPVVLPGEFHGTVRHNWVTTTFTFNVTLN